MTALKESSEERPIVMVKSALKNVTGRALLTAAVGIFYDEYASRVLGPDVSVGLITAYLGVTVGMVGLVLVFRRLVGGIPAFLAGIGTLGAFVFFYTYPSNATIGGISSIIVGLALLFLPLAGRLASPLWVGAGVLGIPALISGRPEWGPFSGFTLLGAALAASGAFVLWGMERRDRSGEYMAAGVGEPA